MRQQSAPLKLLLVPQAFRFKDWTWNQFSWKQRESIPLLSFTCLFPFLPLLVTFGVLFDCYEFSVDR